MMFLVLKHQLDVSKKEQKKTSNGLEGESTWQQQ